MNETLLTSREIPEIFTSVLFDGADGADPRGVLWDLSLPARVTEPGDFLPPLDMPPNRELVPRWPPLGRQAAVAVSADRAPHPRTFDGGSAETVVSHSADRLARAIVLATRSSTDPRTLTAWGQQVGVSRGALRVWCKAAGVSAHSCLDFLRVFRAVVLSRSQAWDLLSLLDVVDQRSLIKLLDRGGVRELCRANPPTVEEFVLRQHFLDNQHVLLAVTRQLQATRD